MASTLRCTSRSMPAMPMADSSAPIVVGIRQTSSATSTIIDCSAPRVDGERLQRDDGEQEDDRQAGQQDVEGDLVRRLLAAGALDQRDHPVEERLARLGGDPHDDPVGQHPGAAGDRRAVAARLADHRRRLAGDGRLVDRGDALDDLAVARDRARRPRRRTTSPTASSEARRPVSTRAVGPAHACATVSARVLRSVSACALPRLGHGLGEVGEQHGEPQPARDQPGEDAAAVARRGRRKNSTVVRTLPTSTTNITGLRGHRGAGRACGTTPSTGDGRDRGRADCVGVEVPRPSGRARWRRSRSSSSCRCSTIGPSARTGK